MSKLFIIGNGFDLYHGVKSSYGAFDSFVSRNFTCDYHRMGKYLSCEKDGLWSDFEASLGKIKLFELAKNNDFFRNYDRIDLENELDRLASDYKWIFTLWIRDVQKEFEKVEPKLSLGKDDYYITFNYTDYLEKSYGIPSNKVLYVNNKINEGQVPCVGHVTSEAEYNEVEKDLECKFRERGICATDSMQDCISSLRNFLNALSKNPESQCLSTGVDEFLKNINVESVFVLGHSLSIIDRDYFKIIKKHISDEKKWYVSYYVPECYRKNEWYIQLKKSDTVCSLKNLLQNKEVKCEAIQLDELNAIVANENKPKA